MSEQRDGTALTFAVVDRKSNNVLGEFTTAEEADSLRDRLIEADPSAADDVEVLPPVCEKCGERHYHRTHPWRAIREEVVIQRSGTALLSLAAATERRREAEEEWRRLVVLAAKSHSLRTVGAAAGVSHVRVSQLVKEATPSAA